MGDGRRPDEPLYVEVADEQIEVLVRCAALQAAAATRFAYSYADDNETAKRIMEYAERFEQWLTR